MPRYKGLRTCRYGPSATSRSVRTAGSFTTSLRRYALAHVRIAAAVNATTAAAAKAAR